MPVLVGYAYAADLWKRERLPDSRGLPYIHKGIFEPFFDIEKIYHLIVVLL